MIIVLGYLSLVLITNAFPKLIHTNYGRLQALKLMLTKLLFIDYNLLPAVSRKLALLIFCFGCFFFFNSNFLSGTIQTESVLVKTDEIIVSTFQMLNSKKKRWPLTMRMISDFAVHRPTLSSSGCRRKVISYWQWKVIFFDHIAKERFTSFYFLVKDVALLGLFALSAPLAGSEGLVAFLKPNKYFEWLSVFYFRSALDEQRKQFIRRWYFFFEKIL